MFPIPDIDSLYGWTMALLRAGGLVSVLPVFSAPAVPMQLRVMLAALLAFLAVTCVPGHPRMPAQPAALVLVAGNELLLGLSMGLIVNVIFHAAEMAGQVVANEMSLTTGMALDPSSGASFATARVLFSNFASVLLLTSGAYHAILFAFLRSYVLAPVGDPAFRPGALDLFVTQTGRIFTIAVQMAAPVIAVNFVVTLGFAVLGRIAPGINVFTESHGVRVLAGLAALGITAGLAAHYIVDYLGHAPELMLRLIQR